MRNRDSAMKYIDEVTREVRSFLDSSTYKVDARRDILMGIWIYFVEGIDGVPVPIFFFFNNPPPPNTTPFPPPAPLPSTHRGRKCRRNHRRKGAHFNNHPHPHLPGRPPSWRPGPPRPKPPWLPRPRRPVALSDHSGGSARH